MWNPIAHDQRLWSAWFSGKANELAWAYLNLGANSQTGRAFFRTTGERSVRIPKPGQYRGGLLGSVDRTFWGTSPSAGEKRSKIHVPLAGDISSMSADLLFAKRPRFEPPEDEMDGSAYTAAVDWCEQRFDDDLHATLLEAAELCSGLGGIYLRVVWDQEISDKPWIDLVHADAAVPTFRYNTLTSVIFWRVLRDDGNGEVHRHLENHDLIDNTIEHAVYVGDQIELGLRADISGYPELGAVTASLDANNQITLPDLPKDASTVTYVPNMKPNRAWRHLPHANPLGRSDYQGIEPLMDALDEIYTSWVRDIRLAKSRLIIPPSYLDDLGPGRGAIADIDREIFTPLNMLAGEADKAEITANQFKIRWQEHQQSMVETVNAALRGAGYAPQTFGDSPTTAMTATEIENRERRTLLTRAKKLNYWRPALADAMYALMWVDKIVYGRNVTPVRPVIVFPDAVLPSLSEMGSTVMAINNAQAASRQTLIKMLHPDWTDEQVDEEVQRMQQEAAFDILGRARVMLQGPQDSTATVGQEVDELADDVQISPDTASGSNPAQEISE